MIPNYFSCYSRKPVEVPRSPGCRGEMALGGHNRGRGVW